MAFTTQTGHPAPATGGSGGGVEIAEFVRGQNGDWTSLSHHHTQDTDAVRSPLCEDGTFTHLRLTNEEVDASGTLDFYLNGVLAGSQFVQTALTEECVCVDIVPPIAYSDGDKLGIFIRNDSITSNDFKEAIISLT